MSADPNPYRSPQPSVSHGIQVAGDPSLRVSIILVSGYWNYRRFRLSGAIEADITWNGWSGSVSVNGRKVKRAMFSDWTGYHYQFNLDTQSKPHKIQLEVRETMLLSHRVSVLVDDRALYSE